MCKKKNCYEGKCLEGKREFCSCEPVRTGDFLQLMFHAMDNMQDMEWEFDYTTISSPEPRRLCAAGACRHCGGRLCISMILDDDVAREELLATTFHQLYLHEQIMNSENLASFKKRYVNMFHEQDRAFVQEWLNQPAEQSATSGTGQPVQIYTIIRSGADAERGIFNSLYFEGSFFSEERAGRELARLVEEEMKTLSERYDKIEEGDIFWEAYEEGCAAAHFTRLEIVTSELMDLSEHEKRAKIQEDTD